MLKMTAKLKPPSHKRSLICPRSVAGASDFPPSRPCSSLSSTAGAKLSAVPWRTFPTAVHSYIAIRYCDRSTAVGSQVEVLLEFPPQARGNSILVWCTCGTRVEGWQVRHRCRLRAITSAAAGLDLYLSKKQTQELQCLHHILAHCHWITIPISARWRMGSSIEARQSCVVTLAHVHDFGM